MKHNYKIYMHKNKINGKVYIGQTSKSLDERCGKNGSGYIGCIRFYNAIQKYGWDNFEHEIIEDNILDREAANKKEIFYIKLYNSTDSNFGYNLQSGGYISGEYMSIEVHQYSLDGYYMNTYDSLLEASDKTGTQQSGISSCINDKNKTAGGYRWSTEKVEYLGELKYDYDTKHVFAYDFNGYFVKEYDSSHIAAISIGVKNEAHIVSCCNGNRTYAYGYQWRYEKYDKIESISVPKVGMGIFQLNTDGSFIGFYESLKDAANIFDNTNNKAYCFINHCLMHKCQTAYGYIWIYEDEYKNFNIDDYNEYFKHVYSKLTIDKVREIKILLRDNDLTQKEMQQLVEQYNTSLSSLNHIKHGRTWKHVVV